MKRQIGIAMDVAIGPPVEDPSANQDLPTAVPAYGCFSHCFRWLPFLLTVPISLPMSKASTATHDRSRFSPGARGKINKPLWICQSSGAFLLGKWWGVFIWEINQG